MQPSSYLDLSDDEASLIVDAMNGYLPSEVIAPEQALARAVNSMIALEGAEERFNVDGARLLARLTTLTNEQAQAVIWACERFWNVDNAGMSLHEQLVEAGLL